MIDIFLIKYSLDELLNLDFTMIEIMLNLFKKCDLGLGISTLTLVISFLSGYFTSFKGLQIFCVFTGKFDFYNLMGILQKKLKNQANYLYYKYL